MNAISKVAELEESANRVATTGALAMTHRSVLISRGLIAGLVATIAISLVIVLQQALGILPQLSTIRVLAQALGFHSIAAGWFLHFVVGVLLWGPLYAWIDPKSSYPHWFIGMMFATGVWLGVMLLIMPVVGAGLFGMELGMVTPMATLVPKRSLKRIGML